MYISELTNLISLKLTEYSNGTDITTESKLDFLSNEFLNLRNLTVQDSISFFEQALLLQLSKKLSNSDRKKLKEFKNQVIEQIIDSLQNALYSLSADMRERSEGKIAVEQRKKEWLFNLIKLNELAENSDINVEIKKLLGAMIPVLKNQQSLLDQLIFLDESLTKPIYLGILNGRTKEDALASVQTVQGYILFRAVTFFVKHPEKWISLPFEEQIQWLKYASQWTKSPRTEMLFNTFINEVIRINDIRENLEDDIDEIAGGEFTEDKKQIFIKNQIIYDILAPAESLKLLRENPAILNILDDKKKMQWISIIKEFIQSNNVYFMRLNLIMLESYIINSSEFEVLFKRLVLNYIDIQLHLETQTEESILIEFSDFFIKNLDKWKALTFETRIIFFEYLQPDTSNSDALETARNQFKKIFINDVLFNHLEIIQSAELPSKKLNYLTFCKELEPTNDRLIATIGQIYCELNKKKPPIFDTLNKGDKETWVKVLEKTINFLATNNPEKMMHLFNSFEKLKPFQARLTKVFFGEISRTPDVLDTLLSEEKEDWVTRIVKNTSDTLSDVNLKLNHLNWCRKNPKEFNKAFKALFLSYINANMETAIGESDSVSTHVSDAEDTFCSDEDTVPLCYRQRSSTLSSGCTTVDPTSPDEPFVNKKWTTPTSKGNSILPGSTSSIIDELKAGNFSEDTAHRLTDIDQYCAGETSRNKCAYTELSKAENSDINKLKESCQKLWKKQKKEREGFCGMFVVGKEKKVEKMNFLEQVYVQLEILANNDKNDCHDAAKIILGALLVSAKENPKINDGRTKKRMENIIKQFDFKFEQSTELSHDNDQKVPTCMGRLMACFG